MPQPGNNGLYNRRMDQLSVVPRCLLFIVDSCSAMPLCNQRGQTDLCNNMGVCR